MKTNDKSIELYNSLRLRDQFIAGDNEAYSLLYRMYASDLYAFGLSLQVNSFLIEDAIHDVFEQIYSHRQCLAGVNNLKFYLMTAFRNRLFLLLKKEIVTTDITEAGIPELIEKDYLDIWIEQEHIEARTIFLKNMMEKLTPNQREVIYHRFIEGRTLDEISSLMGINYQSVKNLLYRSVKKLNELKTANTLTLFYSVSVIGAMFGL